MRVTAKRVYDEPTEYDGMRVLVDRLWPRGLSKEKARVDLWAKELAPSHDLRKWFHGDSGNFVEFRRRYRKELRENEAAARELRKEIGRRRATFLYATKDTRHNHAELLIAFLETLG